MIVSAKRVQIAFLNFDIDEIERSKRNSIMLSFKLALKRFWLH